MYTKWPNAKYNHRSLVTAQEGEWFLTTRLGGSCLLKRQYYNLPEIRGKWEGEGKGEETSNLGRGEKSEVKAAGVLGSGYQRLKEDPSCAQPRKALHFF